MARSFSIVMLLAALLGLAGWILADGLHEGGRGLSPSCAHAAAPAQGTTPAAVIDGAQHPELVPDAVAYRLFFLTVAEGEDPTDQQKARQRAYLKTAGLEEEDVQPAVRILTRFKTEYDDFLARYNDSVRENYILGVPTDLAGFLAQQDEIVESTRDALKAELSEGGMARLQAHVEREKRNMKVAKEDR